MSNVMQSSKPPTVGDNKESVTPLNIIIWRGYLIQRRRSLRTELTEIENILQQIAEQGIDKAPG